MINPADFFKSIQAKGIEFFAGVPDSLLKEFCAYANDNCEKTRHIICANEGNAIAMAVGSYLASGKIPMVYMQNSGLGNAINPLLSLADKEVYGIPILIMIGWRGEPGIKDEPQHIKQGRVQTAILDAIEIPYETIDSDSDDYSEIIGKLLNIAKNDNTPVALVVRKGTFSEYKSAKPSCEDYFLSREAALKLILEADNSYSIVSTTGKTSRELYELRESRFEAQQDFLTVGSMGHSSSIAAAIALNDASQKVMCIDGDGALLMHMGALAVIGSLAPKNFLHVLINNFCHESVGGQETAVDVLNLELLVEAAGYKHYYCAINEDEIKGSMAEIKQLSGPIFFEIRVKKGSRADLGRPKSSPQENKISFMQKLKTK